MTKCKVRDCANIRHKGKSFFRLPDPGLFPELRAEWLRRIGWPNAKVGKYIFVCEDHFRPNDFVPGTLIRKLCYNAVPSIFKTNTGITIKLADAPNLKARASQILDQAISDAQTADRKDHNYNMEAVPDEERTKEDTAKSEETSILPHTDPSEQEPSTDITQSTTGADLDHEPSDKDSSSDVDSTGEIERCHFTKIEVKVEAQDDEEVPRGLNSESILGLTAVSDQTMYAEVKVKVEAGEGETDEKTDAPESN